MKNDNNNSMFRFYIIHINILDNALLLFSHERTTLMHQNRNKNQQDATKTTNNSNTMIPNNNIT